MSVLDTNIGADLYTNIVHNGHPTVAAETYCLYAHVWLVSGRLHTDSSAQHHSASGRTYSACPTQCLCQGGLHTTLGF